MRILSLLALATLASTILLSTNVSPAAVFQDSEPTAESTEVFDGTSTWTVDNEHTSVVCAASHYGLSFIYGRFNKCAGTIEMDFEEPELSMFRFEIDAFSVDTNNRTRDVQLRGPDCLDAAQYKSIIFQSTSVKIDDKRTSTGEVKRTFQVTGNLTMHGETRQITVPLELLAMGNGPENKKRCGFMSRFVINRSEFGLDSMKESVGDSIAVTFCFQAVHQQAETDDAAKAETKKEKLEKFFGTDEEITDIDSKTDSRELFKED